MLSFTWYYRQNIFCLEFVKWILPACSNIHSLTLDAEYERIDACFNIGYLKKLRELKLSGRNAGHFKEVALLTLLITKTVLIFSQIFRNCHQVEKTWTVLWKDPTTGFRWIQSYKPKGNRFCVGKGPFYWRTSTCTREMSTIAESETFWR